MKTVKIIALSLSLATLTACHVVMPAKPIGTDHYHPIEQQQQTLNEHVAPPVDEQQVAARGASDVTAAPTSAEAAIEQADHTDQSEPVVQSPQGNTAGTTTTTAYVPNNDRILRERYVPSQYPYMQRDILSYGLEALVAVGKLCVLSGNCWRL